METIICSVSENFILGGVETYIYQIFEWAKKNRNRFILLMKEGTEVQHEWKKALEEMEISQYSISCLGDVHIDSSFEKSLDTQNVTIIAANFHAYIYMQRWKQNSSLVKMNVFLYVLNMGYIGTSKKKLLNLPFRRMMKETIEDNVLFMDLECKKFAEEKYNMIINERCYRVGRKIDALNLEIPRNKYGEGTCKVLTISRINFPQKEYLMGLIDSIETIWREGYNVELTIIGDGPNTSDLERKIGQLCENDKNKITWVKRVEYQKLNEYINQCHVIVGMGITILDAAQCGVPGIVVRHDCYKAIAYGFFGIDGNETVDAIYDKEYTVEELIKRIINMSERDYMMLVEKTYHALQEEYNIDAIMPQILTKKSKSVIIHRWQILYDLLIEKGQKKELLKKG